MRILIWIVSLIALALAAAILVAGPGARFGVWDYGMGLKMIREVSTPRAIAAGISLSPVFTAAGIVLIGAVVAAVSRRALLTIIAAIAALSAGAAGMVPVKMKAAFEGNPFIHDITTDFADPPAIIAAADAPRKNPAAYLGGDPVPEAEDGLTVAAAQQQAFPDIGPIIVEASLGDAAVAARKVVEEMGMEILEEGPTGTDAGSGWRIEAVYTSTWFGFKDDFIVRLRPEGDGARVDIRSKSRVGGSDLGANAARVRTFAEKFKAAVEV